MESLGIHDSRSYKCAIILFYCRCSLSYQNNQQFTTKDRDTDEWSDNCAVDYHGAWWYKSCLDSNLNGEYFRERQNHGKGVWWNDWQYNLLKRVKMKIRPNI